MIKPVPTFSFSPAAWLCLIAGGFAIGGSKGGLAGIGILPVVFFALVLPARASTGIVLPLLILGDICAIITYHRVAVWKVFWKLLPPALIGVIIGYVCMAHIPAGAFGPLIGGIVLALVALQLARGALGTKLDRFFESHSWGWGMGLLTGFTTMLANAAGPIATLYLLSLRLPKWNFIGTMAWSFFVINLWKVPFSARLGLINGVSLQLTLALAPCVLAGFFLGRYLAGRMPQKAFEYFLLACTAAGALRLIW